MKIGWEQKIGYSFVGLMAGNVASLVGLLIIGVLQHLDAFTGIRQFWKIDAGGAVGLSLAICIVSMLGWLVIGLPTVLLLRAEIAADFYWAVSALIGAVLGLLTMILLILAINQGRLDTAALRNPEEIGMTIVLFSSAALISGVAFAVYCSLVKRALRGQAKENGAPRGTPRSLAWFDS